MNIEVDITGVVLKTERLVLREWKESDLQDFFEYCSVEGVGEMAGWAPHENIEKSKQILDLFIKEKKTFCIELEGKAIGSVGIEKYNEKEFPEYDNLKGREVGFVLSKDYWGRGIMPRGSERRACVLFRHFGLRFRRVRTLRVERTEQARAREVRISLRENNRLYHAYGHSRKQHGKRLVQRRV